VKHLVGKVEDQAVDTIRKVVVDGEEVCLAHAEDGTYYAISDICSHEEFSLSDGELWGLQVECPVHGSRFNLATGACSGPPATEPVRAYPVTVEGDDVYVEL